MTAGDLTFQSFAHELNSQLDGAMRWLGLAERTAGADADPAVRDALRAQLGSARAAMTTMSELIRGAIAQRRMIDLFQSARTIEQELEHIATLVAPQCIHHHIEFRRDVDPRVASLPAGILATVMLNGVRNAIDACAVPGLSCRRITASVTLQHARVLEVLIEDTGAGLSATRPSETAQKEGGHGVGLALSRSLVEQLGGRLELSNVPYGRGAVLTARLDPVRLTERWAETPHSPERFGADAA